jgi:NitT/TauT family transport system permease protein
MAFSVYESLATIPDDLLTAARVSGLSWAGGWYFLIASETIAVGRHTWALPGLGSYIGRSWTGCTR